MSLSQFSAYLFNPAYTQSVLNAFLAVLLEEMIQSCYLQIHFMEEKIHPGGYQKNKPPFCDQVSNTSGRSKQVDGLFQKPFQSHLDLLLVL